MLPAQILRWLAIALASVVGSFVLAQSPAAATISFLYLPKGDRLHISYSRSGFIIIESAEFIYTNKGGGTFSVTEFVYDWKTTEWERHHRGRVFLDPGEPAKLDTLLDIYRTPRPGVFLGVGHTSYDRCRIEQWRGSRLIASEDLSTQALPPDVPAINFETMLAALRRDAARP